MSLLKTKTFINPNLQNAIYIAERKSLGKEFCKPTRETFTILKELKHDF
jgi:hypothetical protein